VELQIIQKKIFEIRGQRVMLDFHLAELYSEETRILVRAVKRNIKRFPARYMFQVTKEEHKILLSQIGIAKTEKRGGTQRPPYAFTEHGITMLSAVLRSDTAIKISIAIVDAFILLKQYNNNFELLQVRIDELEAKYNTKIENINEVINFLLTQPELLVAEKKTVEKTKRNPIGFTTKE
jgi:ORF6N domain